MSQTVLPNIITSSSELGGEYEDNQKRITKGQKSTVSERPGPLGFPFAAGANQPRLGN